MQYRIPGYAGNALLLLLSVIIIVSSSVIAGVLMGALALLNLFLIYKLDQFSQPEAWLAHQLEMTKMREQLLVAQTRIGELEGGGHAAPPPGPQPPT